MSCCQCQGIEKQFADKYVRRDLKRYRKKGARRTTRLLVAALKSGEIAGAQVLDIGGGVGAIQHELLTAGAARAVSVDAASAYVEAAQEEAARRDLAERIEFRQGDFVALAPEIPPADIVTLDRVICCFDEMEALVGASAERAQKRYGVVYPRDAWWVKMGFNTINFFLRLFRQEFRTFIHPTRAVEAIIRQKGLGNRVYYRTAGIWQVAVFARSS